MVPALDRGFAYGDGLFESIRSGRHGGAVWSRHMQRLAEGCARLRMPAPDTAQLWREALEVSRDMPQAVVRITLTRGVGERGYAPPPAATDPGGGCVRATPEPQPRTRKACACACAYPSGRAAAAGRHEASEPAGTGAGARRVERSGDCRRCAVR